MAATQSEPNDVTKELGTLNGVLKDSETTIKQAQAILNDLKEDMEDA